MVQYRIEIWNQITGHLHMSTTSECWSKHKLLNVYMDSFCFNLNDESEHVYKTTK